MPVDETVRHSDEERGVNVRKHLAPALLTVLVGAIGGGIKVMNRSSKQAVAGKVIEHGLVLVER